MTIREKKYYAIRYNVFDHYKNEIILHIYASYYIVIMNKKKKQDLHENFLNYPSAKSNVINCSL